jgi:hypothetical protein
LNFRIRELEKRIEEGEIFTKNLMNENGRLKDENRILIEKNTLFLEKFKNYEAEIKKLKEELTSITTQTQTQNQTNELNIFKSNNIVSNLLPGENALSVLFMTMGKQDIQNYAMTCKNTDLFVTLEQKLYIDFPEYKNYDTYFQVNARRVKRFKTIEENNIKSNDIIAIFVIEE